MKGQKETGSISFKFNQKTVDAVTKAANESRTASYSIARAAETDNLFFEVSVHGDYEETKTVPVTNDAEVTFSAIPVGLKIYIEVIAFSLKDGEREDLYAGHSRTITVFSGENQVVFILKKVAGGSGSGEDDSIEIHSSISFPTLTIKIDSEKSSSSYYLNAFKIAFKASDLNNNPVTSGIKWYAMLLRGGANINTASKEYYTVDQESGIIQNTAVPLANSGKYELFVAAEYNGEMSSATFEIPVANTTLVNFNVNDTNGLTDLLSTLSNTTADIVVKVSGAGVDTDTEDGTLKKIVSAINSNVALDFSEMTGITKIDNGLFSGKAAFIQAVKLPEGITTIGKNAFKSCSKIKEFTIPESVTSIGEAAFSGSGIKEIVIPKNVKAIENQTFQYSSSLTSITFEEPSQVTYFGENSFERTGITELVIPDSLEFIDWFAFDQCNLSTITVSDTSHLLAIAERAFGSETKYIHLIEGTTWKYLMGSKCSYEWTEYLRTYIKQNHSTSGYTKHYSDAIIQNVNANSNGDIPIQKSYYYYRVE